MKFIRSFLLVCVFSVVFTTSAFADQDQKAVLVTGASSGIGLKITQSLADQGYFVYAGARKAEDLERLNAMDNVESVRLDVTVQEDIDQAVARIAGAGRGLYGIVNNAGVGFVGEASSMPESDVELTMDVNVYGPYKITRAFAPMIIESKGRITTIGSISGILSSRRLASYSMSKHAVEAYTDSLAVEMADHGVGVSVVEPGNYQSRIRHKVYEHAEQNGASEEELASLQQWRDTEYKEPDEVAEAVTHALFSETPKRRYMVVPNENEAQITIRQIMREMVQLNTGQPYEYNREQLIEMLDETITEVTGASSAE